MRPVRVKFCGITNLEDAEFAVNLGVAALGFVFYPESPRYVTPADARVIVDALPPFVSAVGLFVNESQDAVRAATDQSRIDTIQFHGDEPPEFCARFGQPWIKAVPVRQASDISAAESAYAGAAGLLLDTHDPALYGGTGKVFDWSMIGPQRRLPIILAGGLSSENLGAALEQVRPYAVDVSGGIELTKGRKDPAKMQAFMKVVREFNGTD